jgi:CheY-like chemotaxis protein
MKRILILEDDEQFQKLLSTILKGEGYEVEAVSDGKQGLKFLTDNKFDLLMIDVFMPEIDGIGVLRKIRNERHGMKIISMSGGGRGTLPGEALNVTEALGVDKSIQKPFTRKEILPLVQELIGE